ncbi:MAG: hypothetical protein R6U20_06915, partial [Longimonas sp.]
TTSENTRSILSEKFIDEMIARGAKFAWFFTYIPVGTNASPELILRASLRSAPDQRRQGRLACPELDSGSG